MAKTTYTRSDTDDVATTHGSVIMTRRRPATASRGVVVKAWLAGDTGSKCRVIMPWDFSLDAAGNACKAASLVLGKLREAEPDARHWREATDLTGGYVGEGSYAFAMRPRESLEGFVVLTKGEDGGLRAPVFADKSIPTYGDISDAKEDVAYAGEAVYRLTRINL